MLAGRNDPEVKALCPLCIAAPTLLLQAEPHQNRIIVMIFLVQARLTWFGASIPEWNLQMELLCIIYIFMGIPSHG